MQQQQQVAQAFGRLDDARALVLASRIDREIRSAVPELARHCRLPDVPDLGQFSSLRDYTRAAIEWSVNVEACMPSAYVAQQARARLWRPIHVADLALRYGILS